MKLFFDHNLSHRLVARLQDIFLHSSHVRDVGLESASDEQVWQYARDHGLCLVSKDSDFNDLVSLRGAPPKLIWLRVGNCTTTEVEALLRSKQDQIEEFSQTPSEDILVLA